LADELPGNPLLLPCDVADAFQVKHFATQVIREIGAPDLVLNNAGIINRSSPLWELSDAEIAQVFATNVQGTVSVIRQFFPAMGERDTGVFVNFSSGWGRSTSPQVAPYCASKFAIEGLSSAFAQELPAGLACATLNPGVIDTGMLRSCFGASAGDYENPDTWAVRAVPFLARLDASCNGQALTLP